MNCINCENDNDRDYPACRACAPNVHFTNRSNCLCDDCATIETLRNRYEMALVGSDRAAQIAIRINRRLAETPIVWCESCFSDACAHCAPLPNAPLPAEQVNQILIENLPEIAGIRFLGAVPR